MSTRDVTVNIPLAPVSHGASTYNSGPSKSTFQDPSNVEKGGLFHRHTAGRRVKRVAANADTRKSDHDGEGDFINPMGRLYNRILNFSVVTRYILYILPISLIFAVPIVIGATAAPNAKIAGVRIVWFFTWIEVVWVSLWVSKLVAQILPWLFQFLCGIVSSGTRKYALVLKALEFPLSIAGWALTSLATFLPLMTLNPDQRAAGDKTPRPWENTTHNVLWAAWISSLIFLGEKLIIQLLSINYHRTQFNAKIKDSKHNVYLLSLLYEASRALFPAYCNEFIEEDYIINDSIATSTKGSKGRSGTATPMRLIRDVGRVGDKITSAFGEIASEITGKQVFNPTAAHSVVVEALEKKRSSEALAKRLWMSFVVEGKDALYQEDIVEVLGSDRQQQAEEAFAAIDKDGNGDISLDEMILTVVDFGRERHAIATSLADVDQAIGVLDRLLCTIAFVIVVFVFVGFLNTSFVTTLATTGTALLSLSFMFAATAQEVLGSCIFLFVKHPYDVGDRVSIDKAELTVEHISLLFSVFKRLENHKTVQVPNIVLNQVWIDNISRSKAMREVVNLYVNFDTTMEDIELLKSEMQAFVGSKENSRDFLPEVEIEITGIAEMNKLELKVEAKHKSNWSNETLRAARRSKFMCALVMALRKIPIYGPGAGDAVLGDVGKPTYSVSITDSEATAFRDEFAAKKDAKRMVVAAKPETKPPNPEAGSKTYGGDYFNSATRSNQRTPADTRPSTAAGTEKTAVENLNARNPAADSARDDWESYRDNMTPESRRENDLEEVRGMLSREKSRGRRQVAPVVEHPYPSPIPERRTPTPQQLGRPSSPPQHALPSTPQQLLPATPPRMGRSPSPQGQSLQGLGPTLSNHPAFQGERREDSQTRVNNGTLPSTTYGRYQPAGPPALASAPAPALAPSSLPAPARSPAGNAFARQQTSSPHRKPA
ncbi:MAG: hypothetical protein M1825_002125 [Sarcosagium campestre]|nr:MAG: hypothetical protein M1825_002125 [Sarcosagium campestre]